MKNLIQPVATLAIGLVFAGCASSSHVMIGKTRPPISPDDVTIYFTPPPIYQEIAMLDASSQTSMDKAIQRLKIEAAKLGANGVLIRGTGERPSGGVSTGSGVATGGGSTVGAFGVGISFPMTQKTASGVAIYVVEEPSVQPTEPAKTGSSP